MSGYARKAVRYPRRAGRVALRAGSLVADLGVWQLLTGLDIDLWLRFSQFPTVTDVAQAFADRLSGPDYWTDLTDSLTRILSGFLLAAALGVATGVLVARSRLAEDLLGPVLEVIRPIPAIALVPVAILLFPSNEQGIVFITFTAAFFPVLVSTRHAVRALTPVWEEAVLTMGGGRFRILSSVVLPGALPGIFGGLSVGIGVSWICVISAEMISGQYGVGYRTWQDYTVVDYPGVFVGMATIGVLGWLTSTAVEVLGRRLTHWLPRTSYDAGARPRASRSGGQTPATSVGDPGIQGAGDEGAGDKGAVSRGPLDQGADSRTTEEARDEHLV
ncbi:ABC transporter permease [Streptomyces sp. NPDC046909]|uniref:ABC transporter permease n=1 Tax=Streptomyces sp. NPDC046909 TaxID=3155617 RepID=UPI00340BB310